MGKMKELDIDQQDAAEVTQQDAAEVTQQDEELDIGEYTIKDPTVADCPDLFEMMVGGDAPEIPIVIKNMLRTCVFKGGSQEPVGDDVIHIPLKYVKMMVRDLTERVGINEKK